MEKLKKKGFGSGSVNTSHPELYAQLNDWRNAEAKSNNISTYQVLSLTSILNLTKSLPTSSAALLKIKGIGKKKIDEYGVTLIELIEDYCTKNNIKGNLLTVSKLKKNKSNTKMITLQLYENGMTVKQIMEERKLNYSTIMTHLTFYVSMRKVDIEKVLELKTIEAIREYFLENKDASVSEAKNHFDGQYSYGEFRMVLASME